MTLHLVYRSYGGENLKRRPPFYSKALTLASFVRAASKVVQAEMVFLNDGPVPAARLAVMETFGRVVQLGEHAQGLRYSYRTALEMVTDGPWPDEDVVCFVEDDYLFDDEAFVALAEAAERLEAASYFTLYGDRPDPTNPADRNLHGLPDGWEAGPDQTVDDWRWFNRASITSTFAARIGALRSDLDIFVLCMGPFRRRFFDHETCLLYQGVVPYHGRELVLGLSDDFVPSLRGVARAAVLLPFRVALNRRARRQGEAHLLYALTPNLATHLEYPVISPDQDWELVAHEVAAWAKANNLAVAGQLSGEQGAST
jgi:glycosyltransferase involved in cell wall biosynthesis